MAETASAVGIRMHSGWGTLVAVSGPAPRTEVIDRRRIVIIDTKTPGAKQPYHHLAQAKLTDQETYLEELASTSRQLAVRGLEQVVRDLDRGEYHLRAAVLLLASGPALPPLKNILRSHSLIHAAEGEFFRQAMRDACRQLAIPVTGYRDRELEERAKVAFGRDAGLVQRRIQGLGKSLGPPWTKDEKTAALAAALTLAAPGNDMAIS